MEQHDGDEILARRRDVVSAMREMSIASQELTDLFGGLEAVMRDAVGRIDRGTRALDVAQSMDLADRRETLNAAAARVRRGRHALQCAMFLLAVAEGDSRAEIARVWRVSRQLVSRMLMEWDTEQRDG
jgi:hypothetical protein